MTILSDTRRWAYGLIAVLAGVSLSYLVYLLWVVPSLPVGSAMPVSWWLGVGAPLVSSLVVAGWLARSPARVAVVAVQSYAILVLYQVVAVARDMPPLRTASILDAFWSQQAVALGCPVALAVLLGYGAGRMALRQRLTP